MIFKETLIKSLSFAVRDLRSPPHVPRTSPLSSAVFHSAGALSAPLSPSFLWKEVPRRGGGWPRETVLPHSGKPTPPRFARLPLPEEGARMIFKETLIKSLSFAVRDLRSPPHVPRTSPLSSAVFHTACALSAPTGHLLHAGKACVSGIAAFPFRSLPHWGRGTASAVDRVLSYIAYLRRSSSLSFIPPEPYPPLRGTFPTRGRLVCRGYPLLKRRRSRHLNPEPRTLNPTTFPLFSLCSMLYCAKMGLEIIQCMNMRVII